MTHVTSLLTDHYELTMVQAAMGSGTAFRRSVFELFPRRLPEGRRYGVVAGTGRALDAIERFDLGRGFCFQTFAVPRIRGAILDELRRYDWISRTGREKLQRLEKTVERFDRSQGVPDDEALIEALGMNEKAYRELLEIASRSYVVSLD